MKTYPIAVAAFFLSAAVSSAADFTQVLTDLDGKAIEDSDHKPFTLGKAAVIALVTSYPDENGLKDIEKFKRAELASKISKNSHVNLSSEETTLVKTLIGKAYGPVVIYKAWPMLDSSIKP
jgi:hypothetical protein